MNLINKQVLENSKVKEITELTGGNNHNAARLILAETMKSNDLVKAYNSLINLHEFQGCMTGLSDIRIKLDRTLFYRAKGFYSNYQDIANSY